MPWWSENTEEEKDYPVVCEKMIRLSEGLFVFSLLLGYEEEWKTVFFWRRHQTNLGNREKAFTAVKLTPQESPPVSVPAGQKEVCEGGVI